MFQRLIAFAFVARADSLTDQFTTPFDYVANGILGDTNWDGVYMGFGDIPSGNAGGSGGGNTLIANTTVFGGGFLGVRSQGGDWSGPGNDGFFIYDGVGVGRCGSHHVLPVGRKPRGKIIGLHLQLPTASARPNKHDPATAEGRRQRGLGPT